MARRSPDDYSNSSDDRSRDLTAQFWGSSPSWRTTGTYRGSRRNGDRTGPVARTRRHGDRTGQIPVVPAVPAVEEPHIDPYDFGFDDVGYGPDQGIAGRRIDAPARTRLPVAVGDEHEPVEQIELEGHRAGGSGDPVTTLAQRLGLGAVDPLLLRLGVIVMIGVLLVPLAMSLRPDSNKATIRTEVTSAPSVALITPGESPGGGGASGGDVAGSAVGAAGDDASGVLQSSDSAPAAPATSAPVVADSTEPPETTAVVADVTESAGDGPAASDSVSASVETLQAAEAMATSASGAAAVDEPATNPIPAVCQLSYTVGAGDYWIRIADAAGVTLSKLLRANMATVASPLYPGDDICLPAGATLPAPPPPPAASSTSPPPTAATPTTTTTTAPSTTVPVTTPLSRAAIEDLIREIWPDDLEDKALAIAWRESGYRASAKNWCCYGIFQIHWSAHKSWLDDIGVTSPAKLLDARTNILAAYTLYQRSGGWGPWGG